MTTFWAGWRDRVASPVDPYADQARPTPWCGWGLVAYACALLLAATIGYFLFHVPLQVSDNIWNIITAERVSFGTLAVQFGVQRPLLWLTLKAVVELAGGHYFEVFRGFHVLQLALLFTLVVRLMGVHRAREVAAVPLLLLMVAGFHTFRNLVQEAYPINTYLSLLVYLAAALNLTIARPSRRVDIAAVLLLLVAVLTVETGLLWWVAYVVAYVCGSRGVSRRAVVVASAISVVFVALVLLQISGGSNGVVNAPTGFGLSRVEPGEVAARFGPRPLLLFAYNILVSILTVLFAEPRRGTFYLVAAWLRDDVRPSQLLVIGTTLVTTLFMAAYAATRVRDWWRGQVPPRDRWIVIFAVVLLANSVLSFAYTKDDIVSPSGLLYAIAAGGVVCTMLLKVDGSVVRAAVLAVPLLALGGLWSLRAVDVPYALVISAMRNQTDWAQIELWKRQNRFYTLAPEYNDWVARLQAQALRMRVANPYLSQRMRLWDRTYSGAAQ